MEDLEIQSAINSSVGTVLLVLLVVGLLVLVLGHRARRAETGDRVVEQVFLRSARGTWLGLAAALVVSVAIMMFTGGHQEFVQLLTPLLATFGSCLLADLARTWTPISRRVSLTSRSWRDVLSAKEIAVAAGLGAVTLAGSAALIWRYGLMIDTGQCVQRPGVFPWAKGYDVLSDALATQVLLLSGLAGVLTVAGLYRAVHRPVVDDLIDSPRLDLALRRLSARRVLGVGNGVHLVLLAVLVPQALGSVAMSCDRTTLPQSDGGLWIVASALAFAGVLVWLIMAVVPVIKWTAPVENRADVG
ncbi:hypothetical protein GCM10022247_72480 [Allokutzneria multivorans]|uniref:ABC transporter permease n=1 Tax=Allokutzneria multivorans TaxID=1142134 RepID=A0ABP7U559_9PSEU